MRPLFKKILGILSLPTAFNPQRRLGSNANIGDGGNDGAMKEVMGG
jgi:hypothetical protein